MKKTSWNTVLAYAVTAALCLCALVGLYVFTRNLSVVLAYGYREPAHRLASLRFLVPPAVICAVLSLLREAMDTERRQSAVTVVLTFLFALVPIAAVVLCSLTGKISLTVHYACAAGIPVCACLPFSALRDTGILRGKGCLAVGRVCRVLMLLYGLSLLTMSLLRRPILLYLYGEITLTAVSLLFAAGLFLCGKRENKSLAVLSTLWQVACGIAVPVFFCLLGADQDGTAALIVLCLLILGSLGCLTAFHVLRRKADRPDP